MADRDWKLSPSDFAFFWEECKCCFYLKVARQFLRPRPIMPKIFTLIDSKMKDFYSGKRTEEIAIGAPRGVVIHGEKWVESQPIRIEGRSTTCHIRGKFDTIARFDDGTYGVIDFKTSQRNAEHISLYSRQLHAYAFALESPTPGNFGASPITQLGLLVFEPEKYAQSKTGCVGLAGRLSWISVPRDDAAFKHFLGDVLDLLEAPNPPPPNPTCDWCNYRQNISK
jgi:hypothetical protein